MPFFSVLSGGLKFSRMKIAFEEARDLLPTPNSFNLDHVYPDPENHHCRSAYRRSRVIWAGSYFITRSPAGTKVFTGSV